MSQNKGSEAGISDVSTTESSEYDWASQSTLDEWNNGPSHIDTEGQDGGTLLGPSESKKFNDASGFISEGQVETKKMDAPVEDVKMLRSLHPKEEQQHSIERIMSRPVKIGTLTFSSQAAAGQIIGSYDVIPTVQTNSRFKLLREKLSSFYGVNFTAHLKVTLNPQPMESGLFQIFFIPYKTTEGCALDPDLFTSNYECMLPYTTGCPNIPCNISKQSEVELAIPYTGPVAFINLTNLKADFGKFYIQNIVPITDQTNAASCELSVYMYFTSVKLFGTTANNVIAAPQGLADLQPSECKEDVMKRGPITQLGNTLLPVLDSLGLSAPDANPNVQRMVINPYSSPATVDSTASALKLSYMFKHHLDIGSLGVNNKVDEMDLRTIAYKPCYYDQFTWTTANDAETLLSSYPVEPTCTLKQSSNVTAPTRFRFVANNFRYWRGSVKYLFMVVANQYHSGRLRFVYSLGGPLPKPYADNYPRSFTQVVDIRKGAHFIIECPFFASTAWRLVPHRWDDTNNRYIDTDNGSLDDEPARLQVYVENELRATSTTSTSVQIVCFQGCGEDFEFACPMAPRSRVFISSNTPDTVKKVKKVNLVLQDFEKALDKLKSKDEFESTTPKVISEISTEIQPESESSKSLKTSYDPIAEYKKRIAEYKKVNSSDSEYPKRLWEYYQRSFKLDGVAQPQALDILPINMASGLTGTHPIPSKPYRFTVGENITSVRQLIKRYQLIGFGNAKETNAYVVYPFAMIRPDSTATMSYDHLSTFSSLYQFRRGSIRYMMVPDINSNFLFRYDPDIGVQDVPTVDGERPFGDVVPINTVVSFPSGTPLYNQSLTATIPFTTDLQGAIEVEFPYYSRFHKTKTTVFARDTLNGDYTNQIRQGRVPAGVAFFQQVPTNTISPSYNLQIYRSAADDFTLGYLLGAPFCVYKDQL